MGPSEQCLIIINFCFRLFLILSTCLARVCRSYNFEMKMWRVQEANLHSGARALSCPSRCQKTWQNIFSPFIVLRCWNSFRQRYKPTNIVCFFNVVKFYTWKINQTRSLENLNKVGQRKRYRNFVYYLCCLSIFSAKLLICSQTLISLNIKLELFEFDVRF